MVTAKGSLKIVNRQTDLLSQPLQFTVLNGKRRSDRCVCVCVCYCFMVSPLADWAHLYGFMDGFVRSAIASVKPPTEWAEHVQHVNVSVPL